MIRTITARDLMNPEVLTVRDDTTVEDLASFLVDNEISGAPVADADGRLVGVVSLTDLARAASGGEARAEGEPPDFFARWGTADVQRTVESLPPGAGKTLVSEIMTPSLFAVSEDTPASEIAEIMIDEHIHRLLVTRDEQVVGIVSTTDLLGLLVDEG